MATHDNAQLLKLCGPRDPHSREMGVAKKGALADSDKNFIVSMKDWKIYKNTL